MEITLSNRGHLLDRDGQITAMKLFSAALDRMQLMIRSVRIALADENGPRGGIDKTCSVQIKLVSGGSLFIKEQAASFNQAIAVSAERAKESVSRWHGKRKTLTKRRGRNDSHSGRELRRSIGLHI